jgi:formiminoglutamate deiminase
MHISEQVKEVEDCLAWCGKRPVEWLLDAMPVDGRWCLIHATHLTTDETRRLAATGATAGLCPVTEANLGDGTFNGPAYLAAGGRFGIGTDSNILIGVADELRQLEYAQRLFHRERNVMAATGGSVGRRLFVEAVAGGAQALGAPEHRLAPDAPADLVAIDTDHAGLVGRAGDQLLDAFVFTGAKAVDAVWIAGRQVVSDGRHVARDRLAPRFAAVMRALAAA